MHMPETIKKVPQLQILKNVFKFLFNPIPIVDQYFDDFESNTFRLNVGAMTKSIITKDPDLIQYILQKNNRNYKKSILQTEHLATFIGHGLLTSNGSYWLKQRRLIQPGFHRKSLDAFVRIMSKEVLTFNDYLANKIKSGNGELLMLKEMSRLALIMVAKTLFSGSITEEQITEIGNKVDYLQAEVVVKIRQPMFAWWRNISGRDAKNKKFAQELYELLTEIISERKESGVFKNDILDMLHGARYEGTDDGMSQQQILDECLVLFAAGYETTANALSWTFYLLDQNRDKLALVQKEIDENEIDPENPMVSLMQLDYIRQVISESMRIFPPAWIIDRIAIENDTFNSMNIYNDEIVNLYVYGVHHDPAHWENPEVFEPNRFTKEKMKSIKPYTYFPFGGGPRLCIGNQFAMMEMQLILYTLLKNFDFKLKEGHQVEMLPGITLRSKNGIRMEANPRHHNIEKT